MTLSRYAGREQAFVKHRLLESYLYKLFMIVGKHHDTISYIDCFAGPWTEGAESLDATSISLSLKIMSDCRESLRSMGREVKFRALYIEKDKEAYRKLRGFLDSRYFGIETESLNGEFFHLRYQIIDWAGTSGFAFFFIDPFGWRNIVEPETLRPLFERRNSEYLVNFMLDFLRRTTGIAAHAPDMANVFGDVPPLEDLTTEEKERTLIKLYQRKLKLAFPSSDRPVRSVTVPVLYPDIDRTMYHLVYLTRHELGIVKFMEASAESDIIQKQIRAEVKQARKMESTGQGVLFGALEQVRIEGQKIDPDEVRRYWLSKLSISPNVFGINELAVMQEETGWFEKTLQEGFRDLLVEGLAKNLDYDGSRKRRTKFIHFEKKERLVKT